MISLKKINTILYLAVIAMGLINLVNSNILATKGIEIDSVYSQTQNLKRQNQQLEIGINKLSRLSYIHQLAEDQGFKIINKITLVKTSNIVAEKPATMYP